MAYFTSSVWKKVQSSHFWRGHCSMQWFFIRFISRISGNILDSIFSANSARGALHEFFSYQSDEGWTLSHGPSSSCANHCPAVWLLHQKKPEILHQLSFLGQKVRPSSLVRTSCWCWTIYLFNFYELGLKNTMWQAADFVQKKF